MVVAVSKEGKEGFIIHAFEWTHRHFPNLMDCRPIYACRALQATGFVIEDSLTESMWVPVDIVRGRKPSWQSDRGTVMAPIGRQYPTQRI